jgi:hypothetical protein
VSNDILRDSFPRRTKCPVHDPWSPLDAVVERPVHHLQQANKMYRGLWAEMDRLRARRALVGGWPAWCLLPAAAAYEAELALGRDITAFETNVLSALFTWRTTQGVYCFDHTIFDELWSTPIAGDIPSGALETLPEWCCYIVFPRARTIAGFNVAGYFASLNYDLGDRQRDLNLVLDATRPDGNTYLAPACLRLAGTLQDSISASVALTQRCVENDGGLALGCAAPDVARAYVNHLRSHSEDHRREFAPLISLLLYLVSVNRDLRCVTLAEPVRPKVQHTRRGGPRIFPPSVPRVWEVGYRIGATIRAGQAAVARGDRLVSGSEGRTHTSPRPHLRKAHYHHFWTGPLKGERHLIVKWLHPILVGVGESEDSGIIPTVHRVAGPPGRVDYRER